MARRRDALASKSQLNEPQYSTSLFTRAERRLSVFLRDIELGPIEVAAPVEQGRKKLEHPLRAFLFTDIFAFAFSFLCAWLFALNINVVLLDHGALATTAHDDLIELAQFSLIAAGVLCWFGHTSHYQLRMPFWMEVKKIVEAIFFAVLISCFLQVVAKNNFSRLWLLSCWGFSVVSIIALRMVWRAILRRRGQWQISTLLVGDGPTADEALAALASEPGLGYAVSAHVRDLPQVFQAAGYSWKNLCRQHNTDYVVIALDGEDFIDARQSLAQLMREHVPFSVSPPMQNLSVFGMAPQSFLGHDVMLLTRNNGLDRPLPRFLKRSFDVTVSGLTLLALSPAIGIMALLAKMDGGPAFYKHNRIGLNGEIFPCLKFRSMVPNSADVLKAHLAKYPLALAEWNRDHKLRKDPRITKLGAFLRRTSLDELPQLVNVLKGEMSIVGPRPIIVEEASRYSNDIAFYYRVRPGITGLWQVSGRNDVSYDSRVRMDSWYVRNWSLWHDITIICKTFSVVLKQRGAY